MKATGLTDNNWNQIYEGDKFEIPRHFNPCCQHYVICEIRKDEKCQSGYGLFDIKTGLLIVNGSIAEGYSKLE